MVTWNLIFTAIHFIIYSSISVNTYILDLMHACFVLLFIFFFLITIEIFMCRDLIDLITDLELEDPRCDYHTIHGYMSFDNLYYDNNGTLKMRVYPDPTHKDFKKLCSERKIIRLREGFAILCTVAMPDSVFEDNTSLRRDYEHFKSLAELDLST